MQTAAIRIKQAKDNFCEMMDKINARLNGSNVYLPHSAATNVPRFTFPHWFQCVPGRLHEAVGEGHAFQRDPASDLRL